MENLQQGHSQESGQLQSVMEGEIPDFNEILDLLLRGGKMADALGITSEHLDAVYSLAHYRYMHGKYLDAMKLFQFLLFHDPQDRRGMLGFGGCCQMMGMYEYAEVYLGLAVLMEPSDPTPGVQFAECLLLQGRKSEAISLLHKSRKEFGKIPEYQELMRKVDALLELANGTEPVLPVRGAAVN